MSSMCLTSQLNNNYKQDSTIEDICNINWQERFEISNNENESRAEVWNSLSCTKYFKF